MRLNRPVLVASLVALLVLPGDAQVNVSTVPVSRDTITLRVVADGTPVEITVQNGGLARISRKGGAAIGLIPAIAATAVDLRVVEIVSDPVTGNEGARQVAKVRLAQGVAQMIEGSPVVLEVQLLRTAPPATQNPGPAGPCLTCCVTCGEQTVCACLVIMECGWCCCPGACPCPARPGGAAACQAQPPAGTPAPR